MIFVSTSREVSRQGEGRPIGLDPDLVHGKHCKGIRRPTITDSVGLAAFKQWSATDPCHLGMRLCPQAARDCTEVRISIVESIERFLRAWLWF
jgi:hypothetical protein